MTGIDPETFKYTFANPSEPWRKWFAWHPVRCWDGRMMWLRFGYRRRMALKKDLIPIGNEFWVYSRYDTIRRSEDKTGN